MSEFGQKLVFDKKGYAVCSESEERYHLENGNVSKII
jgi:hypothetical protein